MRVDTGSLSSYHASQAMTWGKEMIQINCTARSCATPVRQIAMPVLAAYVLDTIRAAPVEALCTTSVNGALKDAYDQHPLTGRGTITCWHDGRRCGDGALDWI